MSSASCDERGNHPLKGLILATKRNNEMMKISFNGYMSWQGRVQDWSLFDERRQEWLPVDWEHSGASAACREDGGSLSKRNLPLTPLWSLRL